MSQAPRIARIIIPQAAGSIAPNALKSTRVDKAQAGEPLLTANVCVAVYPCPVVQV